MENLLKEIKRCTLCQEHLPLGPRPVLQADPRAKILVVGQAPGTRVHHSGVPFNDPSGDRLRNWMGLDSEAFYDSEKVAIVPMGFCYPGRGKSGDLPPRKECAEQWRARILQELNHIELTLAIGQYAIAYHLPNRQSTLTETVRLWSETSEDSKIIPLPHPSPRNNLWLRRNLWFEESVIPRLRNQVQTILN